jgi:inhibitor of cysteine peptidase
VKTRLFLAAALVVALAAAGCSSIRPASKTIEISMDEVLNQSAITRDVTMSIRHSLKVSLGSNHTTPYRWTADPKIGDSTILKQTSHDYVQPRTDRVGAPGREVWMFIALKAGTTTIQAQYASIVGSDPTPTCVFTAKVTVQ